MDGYSKQVVGKLADAERSQAWLARRVGVTPSALHNYLHGKRPWPRGLQQRIADVLDIRQGVAA